MGVNVRYGFGFALFLSMIGTAAGDLSGLCLKARAEIAGGVILICMGVKILAKHLHLF